ncbi:MAG: MFS transporter [Alphaproteobacteria bacterium]|nr:MFS transporter [Alphaproteobacteria bacterium]
MTRLTLATRVFTPFALGYFLSYLFRTVNAVIAPDLARAVVLDAAALGLMTSAYFLTFAAAQLPLGILLDRLGPRRVESALLLIAALGALTFSRAESATGLIAGRALIGFGVSACLMAAFKANVQWFPRERLALVNGLMMASGGLGALAATAPVEAALRLTDWRGVFAILALATLGVAATLFLVVPEHHDKPIAQPLSRQVRDLGRIFKSRVFWRVAPFSTLSQSTFLSIQGLWLGPWLRDVAGLDRAHAANHLFFAAAAMVAGFVLIGALAERLGRLGVSSNTVAAVGMVIFLGLQVAMAAGWAGSTMALMVAFGFFGVASTLNYANLTQAFPPDLSGRVNTALNLLIFIGAFASQAMMGAIVDVWPRDGGAYPPAAYGAAFGLFALLQAIGLAWYLWAGRLPRKEDQEQHP